MIFIKFEAKDRLLKALSKQFHVIIPNPDPAAISKMPTPIAKRTLIKCLSRTTKSVWIVRHGLKDQDIHFLSKNIEMIPDPSNRVDIGVMYPTENI